VTADGAIAKLQAGQLGLMTTAQALEYELVLAGWTVLEFTSAFTDGQIAARVAEARGLPGPAPPELGRGFSEWKRLR
jgi:hypothetical protein